MKNSAEFFPSYDEWKKNNLQRKARFNIFKFVICGWTGKFSYILKFSDQYSIYARINMALRKYIKNKKYILIKYLYIK